MSAETIEPKPVSAKDFEKFEPEARYDLIEGELHPMPPMPGYEHGELTNTLAVYAGMHVIQHTLGACFAAETRFVIQHNPDTALGPDWAFIAKDRLPKRPLPGFAPIVPDAVLEVRSPSDSAPKALAKIERWLAAGVKLVWEIDPGTRTLTVYRVNQAPRRRGDSSAPWCASVAQGSGPVGLSAHCGSTPRGSRPSISADRA